jgi:hypothetical protein
MVCLLPLRAVMTINHASARCFLASSCYTTGSHEPDARHRKVDNRAYQKSSTEVQTALHAQQRRVLRVLRVAIEREVCTVL